MMDSQDIINNAFAIIANARKLHIINKDRKISEKTRQTYNRNAERLLLIDKITPIDVARTKSSYYVYKASIISYLLDKISATIPTMDSIRKLSEENWLDEVSNLRLYIDFIDAIGIDHNKLNLLKHKNGTYNSEWSLKNKEHIKAKKSKSRRLWSLPKDWAERIFTAALESNSSHTLSLSALMITGCRPQELNGLELSLNSNGSITAKIIGAKTHDNLYGQSFRTFQIISDTVEFHYLHSELEKHGGSLTIQADAGAICDKVYYLSKKTMPQLKEAASAYCFRHRFSGDLHKLGLDNQTIGKALGHSTTTSQGHYSRSTRTGATGFSISNIDAANPVKVHSQSKNSQKQTSSMS